MSRRTPIVHWEHNPIHMKEFTTQEPISEAKKNKAAGLDQILNEHLKASLPALAKAWTELYNECLQRNAIPEKWRRSTIKVMYKGKGDAGDMNAHTPFKIFSKLLLQRLMEFVDHIIPEEQFGFRRGRSTLQAIQCLHNDVQDALQHRKRKLIAVFIDYTKAFDLVQTKNDRKTS
jgi:hypothetical protein